MMAERRATKATFDPSAILDEHRAAIGWTRILMTFGGTSLFFVGPVGVAIGLPVVFAAFLLVKPKKGVWKGNCPHCNFEITTRAGLKVFDCPICGKRVVQQHEQYHAVTP